MMDFGNGSSSSSSISISSRSQNLGGHSGSHHADEDFFKVKKSTGGKVDKFKVTGTQRITNQTGSQAELRKAIGYMVGVDDSSREIEFSLKQADSIAVNGKEVWNASSDRVYKVPASKDQDPRNEWSENSSDKFSSAAASFKTIKQDQGQHQLSQPRVAEMVKALDNLNLDPIACAWNMMSKNYQLSGKSVNFYLKVSGPHTSVKLEREGLQFSLIFNTAIYTFMDFNTGQSFELDEKGEPRLILDLNMDAKSSIDPKFTRINFLLFNLEKKEFSELNYVQNETQFIDPKVSDLGFALFDVERELFFMQYDGELIPIVDPREHKNKLDAALENKAKPAAHVSEVVPIARMTVKTVLDFTNAMFHEQAPHASIEITIQSDHEKLRYIGSRKAPEIVSLQNIDQRNRLELNQGVLGFSVPDLAPLAATVAELSDANFKAGNLVNQIIPSTRRKNYQELLTSILELFNQTTRLSLLRLQLSKINREAGSQVFTVESGTDLVKATLLAGTSLKVLLAKTKTELSIIFYKIKSQEFAQLLNLFYASSSEIPEAREAAVFASQCPEKFLEKDYLTDPDTVKKFGTAIFMAIDVIKSALDMVANRRRFELLNFKKHSQYSAIQFIPKTFVDFLNKSIQDFNDSNPLLNTELSILAEKSLLELKDREGSSYTVQNFDLEDDIGQPLLTNNIGFRENDVRILRHSNLPPSAWGITFRGGEPEKIAALWLRNPFIKAINDGMGIHEMIKLFLTLYPEASSKAAPYLVVTDIIGGLVGVAIGRHAILNPRDRMNTFVRTWEAGTDGLIVYIFSLNAAIRIFLTLNPDVDNISDELFWSQIASVPLFLSASFASWHCIPPDFKERIFGKNSCLKITRSTLDLASKFVLYAGTFQYTSLRVIETPRELAWELSPIIPGLAMAALSRTRFRERVHGVMTYLASANLIYTFGKSMAEILGPNHGSEEIEEGNEISAYIRCGFWTIVFVGSTVFVINNTVKFIQKYQGDPEVIVQSAPVQELEEEGENLDHVLNQAQYESLRNPEPDVENRTLDWMRQMYANRQRNGSRRISNTSTPDTDEQPRSRFSCTLL